MAICKFCDKEYASNYTLNRHIDACHQEEEMSEKDLSDSEQEESGEESESESGDSSGETNQQTPVMDSFVNAAYHESRHEHDEVCD